MTGQTHDLPDDLIDIPEAAKLCHGAHHHTIRRWILTGRIPGYRIGGRKMLVSRRELLASLIKPIEPKEKPTVPTGAEVRANDEWVDRVLRDAGVRK